MGYANIKGKVRLMVDGHTFSTISQHYFGRYYDGMAIPCGNEMLDRYEGTSTIGRCKKIAGDGMLSAADLFVHHIFRKKIVPQRLRGHVVAGPDLCCGPPMSCRPGNKGCTDHVIFVTVPFLKYVLEKFGLRAKGRPELKYPTEYYDLQISIATKCRFYSEAIFFAKDIDGTNANYREFTSMDRINSSDIMRRLQKFVRNTLSNGTAD